MRKTGMIFMASLLLLMGVAAAFAAEPLRVFIGDFAVVGGQAKDESKAAVQSLLASRINGPGILAVASAAEAEAIITGTYLVIGKITVLMPWQKLLADRPLPVPLCRGKVARRRCSGQQELWRKSCPLICLNCWTQEKSSAFHWFLPGHPSRLHRPVAAAVTLCGQV